MTTISKLTRSVRGLARTQQGSDRSSLLEGYPAAPLLSHLALDAGAVPATQVYVQKSAIGLNPPAKIMLDVVERLECAPAETDA